MDALGDVIDLVPRRIVDQPVNLILDVPSRPVVGIWALEQHLADYVSQSARSHTGGITEHQHRGANLIWGILPGDDLDVEAVEAVPFGKRA